MQHLEVSCAVRRFFKSLGFKGIIRHRDNFAIGCCWVLAPLTLSLFGTKIVNSIPKMSGA